MDKDKKVEVIVEAMNEVLVEMTVDVFVKTFGHSLKIVGLQKTILRCGGGSGRFDNSSGGSVTGGRDVSYRGGGDSSFAWFAIRGINDSSGIARQVDFVNSSSSFSKFSSFLVGVIEFVNSKFLDNFSEFSILTINHNNLDFRHDDDDNDGANDEWEEKASGFGGFGGY
ncbi:hypothetical protein Glove_320g33 [Diversispora epigaea]|uniref:Uncharacterized protein n=1 Tax=Diversispora epigaea TaxID=1348612 RepID=A0A397HUH6_9GLOM|nr:hypothetical protein Glove_320g33 [Diversispora epigaea]